MRDVLTATLIYSVLFVILTTPVVEPVGGMSIEFLKKMHVFASELIFWVATFYICASATYGAFARQDRFGISQNHPFLNRALSLFLIAAPFLALFLNVRFMFLLLGLLLFSHLKSKTEEEREIDFTKSRAFSNMILIPLFTLALMLMNNNGYYVSSILDFNSFNSQTIAEEVTTDAG